VSGGACTANRVLPDSARKDYITNEYFLKKNFSPAKHGTLHISSWVTNARIKLAKETNN